MAELTKVIKERKYVRQRVTKLCDKITESLSLNEKLTFTENLKELKTELEKLNRRVFDLLPEDGDKEEESIEADSYYDEKISYGLATLRTEPNSQGGENGSLRPMEFQERPGNQSIRLPQIPFPEFGNKPGENLRKFLRSFESIISKSNLNSYEMFVYLRKQLSEGPRALIDSLDVEQHSYEEAKSLLMDAFDCTKTAKFELIRRTANLCLPKGKDPYSFVGDVRAVRADADSLQITVNDFIQFFVWNGMNNVFQDHLVNIVNKNMPSIDEIMDNIFEATNRYNKELNRQKTWKSENKKVENSQKFEHETSLGMATNVEVQRSKDEFCVLCKHDNKSFKHSMRFCTTYPDAKSKVTKLKDIGGCTKCSFNNHSANGCKFVFKSSCRYCDGNHMSYLCLKNQVGKQDNYSTTQTRKSIVESCKNTVNEAIMLPTFTAYVENKEGERKPVRVFKDTGSQKTFVTRNMVKRFNLKTIDPDVSFVIKGFNSERKIRTSTVELPLFMEGGLYTIQAVVVDSLSPSFDTGRLDIVIEEFLSKGYKLADIDLICCNGHLEDIEVTLGEDFSHIMMPLSYETFGDDSNPSTFILSKLGVILTGNVDQMIENLINLPDYKQTLPKYNEICTINSKAVNTLIQTKGLKTEADVLQIDMPTQGDLLHSKNCQGFQTLTVEKLDSSSNTDEEELLNMCSDLLEVEAVGATDNLQNETNKKLISYVLNTTERDETGRLVMPLTWNNKNCHLLGNNYNLSLKVLQSNVSKLKQNASKLQMYNDVFKDQEKQGIIQRIENVEEFMEDNPNCSFLPHMGVFKPDRETTKCRVVLLSNLCVKSRTSKPVVSHNQAMLPGPCLNHKIITALMMLRFDKFMIIFDIKKAFLMIGLRELDQNRLMLLWYKNVERGDFSLIAYRCTRLSFGLRCSPFILMLALYKILILDPSDSEASATIKKNVYNNLYMDNGSYSCNDDNDLEKAYEEIVSVFGSYCFELQQVHSNSEKFQSTVEYESEDDPKVVNLLGMEWNKVDDTISSYKISLNEEAQTKKSILSTLNSVYDVLNVIAPLILRAKLFMQRLQCDSSLGWNDKLSDSLINEWRNIARQINSSPTISLKRFMGERSSEYSLIAFTDSSKDAFGTVVYIKDVRTNQISFLSAKNRLVNSGLVKKTIPSLELHAIKFGVEVLQDIREGLSGEMVVVPIKVTKLEVYTDSMVCLHWLHSYAVKFNKIQKQSVFVVNRLREIDQLCRDHKVTFNHIAGEQNPADYVTRPCSYRLLMKTCYLQGPSFLKESKRSQYTDLEVTIPNPMTLPVDEVMEGQDKQAAESTTLSNVTVTSSICENSTKKEHLLDTRKYSSFSLLVRVHKCVKRFINNIKRNLNRNKMKHHVLLDDENLHSNAANEIIRTEQMIHFPEIFEYLDSTEKQIKKLPLLVSQLNIFPDTSGVLRVKGKFSDQKMMPVLLPKRSDLTVLIIRETHETLCHSGIYFTIRELRKNFWITQIYSTVKSVLKNCVICRRFNARNIKLNKNSYRDFRVSPQDKPFGFSFVDYIGPFEVKLNNSKTKVWILILTCLWSRAVNLKVCLKADVKSYLRAIQLHIYQYGIFQYCMSDQGSQICAGAKIMSLFLDDFETQNFFESHGIQKVEFKQYAKGNSALGSLVETCVKGVKRLMMKSIKNLVLDFFDFELLVEKTIHLMNKRPISVKDCLRVSDAKEVPIVITPELLLKGYETCSVNVIPQLQNFEGQHDDPDFIPGKVDSVENAYEKLRTARERLVDLYHSDFIQTLLTQATDDKNRYKQNLHHRLEVGDIVLLYDKYLKRHTFPMGRVVEVETNSLNEVTAAYVLKGGTRERVYRHSSSLILLIPSESKERNSKKERSKEVNNQDNVPKARPQRAAAAVCKRKLKNSA